MRTFVASHPLVPECATLLDGTLRYERHAVVVLAFPLPHTVPVNGHFHPFDMILYVYHDLVALTDLDAGPRHHSVRC